MTKGGSKRCEAQIADQADQTTLLPLPEIRMSPYCLLIFATSFARSSRPKQIFGADVAGAFLGGLAANASMLLGFRYLIVVAALFYLLSSLGGRRAK